MCRFGVPLTPVAEPLDGPWADEVRAIAARYDITVLAACSPRPQTAASPIRCWPPDPVSTPITTRSTCMTLSGSKNPDAIAPGREPVVITVDGVGSDDPVLRHPLPGALHRTRRPGASIITVSASWGPGRANSISGPCSPRPRAGFVMLHSRRRAGLPGRRTVILDERPDRDRRQHHLLAARRSGRLGPCGTQTDHRRPRHAT